MTASWHEMAAQQARAKQAIAAADSLFGVDARRTARRKALLESGVHPRTMLPLLQPADPAKTCGSCAYHFSRSRQTTFHKCGYTPWTRGPATDVRVSWPACTAWTPEPDAAA